MLFLYWKQRKSVSLPQTWPPSAPQIETLSSGLLTGGADFLGCRAALRSLPSVLTPVHFSILQAHAASTYHPYFCTLPWCISFISPCLPLCPLSFSPTSPGLSLAATPVPAGALGSSHGPATAHLSAVLTVQPGVVGNHLMVLRLNWSWSPDNWTLIIFIDLLLFSVWSPGK